MKIPAWKSKFEKVAAPDPMEADLKKAFLAISKIAGKYASYQRGSSSSPAGPDTTKFRATHSGTLEPFRNRMDHGGYYGFNRHMLVGLNIGSNFANPEGPDAYKPGGSPESFYKALKIREEVVKKVEADVKKVLQKLVDKYGGFIHKFDGSNFGGLGWVAK